MNKYMKLLLAGVLFSSFVAHAEVAPLTIQSAVQIALDKNPDAVKAREALRQSDANLSLAIAKIFPTIGSTLEAKRLKASAASSSPLFGGDPYNQYLAQLTLNQPLYDGALSGAYKYSKKDHLIKEYQLEVSERTLTLSVIENFYSVLLQERLLQILKDTQKVSAETLAISERYFKIGRAQKIDVLQLKTQAALLSPKIAQADSKMRTAAAQLATLLRSLESPQIRLKGSLVSPEDQWVKKTSESRKLDLPEILQAKETVEQFGASRDITMAAFWPKLNLVGNLQRQAYTKREVIDSNTTSWSVALELNIPIFSGLSSFYQRSALASQERQLELDETKTSDTVSVNQIQSERDLQVAQTELESSRQAALYGRESLQEAQKSYRLQTINYLQYQTSQQAFLDSESGYYQAKYNYIVATAKYFSAIGVPVSMLVAKLEELSRQTIER